MEILYMGTAAAEGYPALFCECERCKAARKLKGKNIRSRSQALIDGKILIDFNADSLWHSVKYNIDLTYIKTLLITHVHDDHLYPCDLSVRREGFAHLENCEKLNIYGSCDIIELLNDPEVVGQNGCYGCELNTVQPYKPFCAEGYKITALKAEHGTPNPYLYLIEKNGKALLYAHDTGLFPEETLDYLKKNNVKLDLVSLDCTEGNGGIGYPQHMNLERDIVTKDKLTEIGAADAETVFILNHFSHNGAGSLYDEFLPVARENGFDVSYDGMKVEV